MAAVSKQVPDSLIADRYRVQEQIGAGGMGVVWKAWDQRLHRPVAIKQLHPARGMGKAEAERAIARAMREARITARLHHQHAVQIFDVVEQDGLPCLIMPYLPSRSLQAILKERGPLAPGEVAKIGGQVASALAAAHEAGIVHRDVTPGNILITPDGSAKISDFGISRALGDTTVTSTGMVIGTPAYLAPEVARGGPTSQSSDVFSLGATLYAAVEGTPPFGTHENSMALLHQVASGRVAPPRRAGALTPLLGRLLAHAMDARPSMAEAAEELMSIADQTAGVPATVPPESPSAPAAAAVAGVVPDDADGLTEAEAPQPPQQPLHQPVARPPGSPGTSPATNVLPSPSAVGRVRAGAPEDGRADASTARSRRNLAFAVVGLAAGLVLVLALVVSTLGNAPRAAAPKSSPSPTHKTASQSSPPASAQTSATPTASPTSQTSPRPSATSVPPPSGRPTAAQLADAIVSYYGLVPGNTDAGWSRLTHSYQTTTAGGRDSYESFWASVQRVSVRDVTGEPPGTAAATLTYSMKDGRTIRERTAFGLVRDGGILKINTSEVLSSQQL